jgi:YegS/Rv2252/BmrU family lipid kinase
MSGGEHFRTFVVVNPNSSKGATGRRWERLAGAIREGLGGPFEHALTKGPGDATALTRQALLAGFELVVAVGGDGTNNEVVNGFFEADGRPLAPEAAFAHVPSGTGGDFRKTIGLGADPVTGTRLLGGRRTRPIDVGRATFVGPDGRDVTRFFLNITSFGIGGLVDRYVNRSTKRLGGRLSFFLAATRAMLTYRNRAVRLRVDDGEPQALRVNNIAVANGRFFGGGMQVAPEARLDDGLFDVVTFGDLTTLEYVALAGAIYRGTHIGRPKIGHTRGRLVVAECDPDDEVLIDMDGEQPGRLPIRLELLPGALRLKIA